MSDKSSSLVDQAARAMEAAEPSQALSAVCRLIRLARVGVGDGAKLEGIRDSFTYLLRRRGYAVSMPSEMACSLNEIYALGEGFDLYELSRSLAELDAILVDCSGQSACRLLPELARFDSPSRREEQAGMSKPQIKKGE